jgi:hypothetical protein
MRNAELCHEVDSELVATEWLFVPFYCEVKTTDGKQRQTNITLAARYLRASLTISNTHVAGQPAEVRERREGKRQGTWRLAVPLLFPSSLPILLRNNLGLQILRVWYMLSLQLLYNTNVTELSTVLVRMLLEFCFRMKLFPIRYLDKTGWLRGKSAGSRAGMMKGYAIVLHKTCLHLCNTTPMQCTVGDWSVMCLE